MLLTTSAKCAVCLNTDTQPVWPDLLEQRAEAAPDDLRRTNTLYMYGVDLMSTADCQAYLAEHGPVHIEWLNDSSCNAVLRDAASAARALVSMGTPLPPDAAVPDGSSDVPLLLCLCRHAARAEACIQGPGCWV